MSQERIYLKDYQKPQFTIDQVDLHVDIFDDQTTVTNSLKLTRTIDDANAPLVLHGENQILKQVILNDTELSADQYQVSDHDLTIPNVGDSFSLKIISTNNPYQNTALEGFYASGDILCTQCESEGFRRITYYLDRPDVMSKFTTTVVADKTKYPVLLANGNLKDSGDLEEGRHYTTWEDPFLKPSYLFAMVAGDLDVVRDTFTTCSGREIALSIYVDKGNQEKSLYALESLKRAIKWDEDTFGLECDLDNYMVVAVDAFNFGAMENKGLNIFNSQYVLADPKTATDANFEAIEGVIGHEYFHNWTGNRVTCRDWFQITLKEGLTVYRDQEFSSDMQDRAVKRINDVRMLRDYQFVEDAGPNAHPIRPPSYIEVNNFYTLTVYEKGSEIIRMIQTLIGRETFRKGIDKYFELYDGQAVTTDDFVSAMEQASDRDLSQFKTWYDLAGTPTCKVSSSYDEGSKKFILTVEQSPSPVAKVEGERPYHLPLSLGLLDAQGNEMGETQVLEVTQTQQSFELEGITSKPVPSLFRNFSAPVHVHYDYSDEELMLLVAHDSDDFNRFDAGQRLATRALNAMIESRAKGEEMQISEGVLDCFGAILSDPNLSPDFKAEALILPSLTALTEPMEVYDFDGAYAARQAFNKAFATKFKEKLLETYHEFKDSGPYEVNATAIGRRKLKNRCLGLLSNLEDDDVTALVKDQFESATNMTDEISALGLLGDMKTDSRNTALNAFYEKWQHEFLVINKWFVVQSCSRRDDVLEQVKALEKHEAFTLKNPNRARSLIGGFAQNTIHFHAASGSGYEYIANKVIEVDEINPKLAAGLCRGFNKMGKLDPERKAKMKTQLDRILAKENLSGDTYEIISNILKVG